jgi:hypothetical protein
MTEMELRTCHAFVEELCKIAEAQRKPLSKADAMIYRALVKGSPVKIKVTEEAKDYGGGYFDPEKKLIAVDKKDFSVLAHELGHADLDKGLLGRMLQSRLARLAYMKSGIASIGAGILMAKGKKWGLLLPALAVAPTLASEALATSKGRRLLDELKAGKRQLQKFENVTGKGMTSYVVKPIEQAFGGVLSYALSKAGISTRRPE